MSDSDQKKRVLFIFTEDWAFSALFLDRAVAARQAGFEVAVHVRCTTHREKIEREGLRVIPHNISRSGTNPFSALWSIWKRAKVFRDFRPHIVHLIAIKPIVLGSLASFFYPEAKIINAPVGMGYLFASNDLRARVLRPAVRLMLGTLLGRREATTIIENSDDLTSLVEGEFLNRNQIVLIRGTGVNLEVFTASPEPEGNKVVVLVARMLIDKGVFEFVESANEIRKTHPDIEFWLVGDVDLGNPASLTSQQLQDWATAGVIKWLGYRNDVAEILKQCHIVCLPSYREGFGKVFVEAGATQRAVVATNVPGCREAVEDGRNGLLVEPKNVGELTAALIRLLDDDQLRLRMAAEGRNRAENEFSSATINKQTIAVYQQVLKSSSL
jgi:glycosyltransferase involved in cell wall biosynthesis